jgi:hypothetical protein
MHIPRMPTAHGATVPPRIARLVVAGTAAGVVGLALMSLASPMLVRAGRWCAAIGVSLAVVGLAVAAARAARAARDRGAAGQRWRERLAAIGAGSLTPIACGLVTALVVWWCWGSLHQLAVYHDERAYLLQAQTFARGMWAAPPPPHPEFFQQLYVFGDTAIVVKYPPGHALLLTPGAWLGLPGLAPVVLAGLAGAMIVVLVRRIAGVPLALLTWGIWLSEPATLRWHASYFSESTTTVLWLVAWWALLRWREERRAWALAVIGVCVGWGAMTRPLTMAAFAVPVGLIIARAALDRHRWRDVAIPVASALVVLGVVPIWSAHTTGRWWDTPLGYYTREYYPWDHPGFGLDSTPPVRALAPDLRLTYDQLSGNFRDHTIARAPATLAERLAVLGGEFGFGWRRGLIVFAVVGVSSLSGVAFVPVATAALLVLAYLTYAHFPAWTLYYEELLPVLAFLAALGIARVIAAVAAAEDRRLATAIVAVALVPGAIVSARTARTEREAHMAYDAAFQARLSALGPAPILVFVHYGPGRDAHTSLVGNSADPNVAHAWVVYDHGVADTLLIRSAPGRRAYRYDEGLKTLRPIDSGSGGRSPSPTDNARQ